MEQPKYNSLKEITSDTAAQSQVLDIVFDGSLVVSLLISGPSISSWNTFGHVNKTCDFLEIQGQVSKTASK